MKLATITEEELNELETRRAEKKEFDQQLKRAVMACEELEQDIMNRLRAGAKVQGTKTAVIEEKSAGSRPAWKDEYLEHMVHEHQANPVAEENAVKDKYPPKPIYHLVVGQAPVRARG